MRKRALYPAQDARGVSVLRRVLEGTSWSVATPDEAKADWVGDDPTLVLR